MESKTTFKKSQVNFRKAQTIFKINLRHCQEITNHFPEIKDTSCQDITHHFQKITSCLQEVTNRLQVHLKGNIKISQITFKKSQAIIMNSHTSIVKIIVFMSVIGR